MEWKPIDDNTPRDREILVWFDHDADPYLCPSGNGRLTDYGALAEGSSFLNGKGMAIVRWYPEQWENTDEYGSGYVLPGGWYVGDADTVCNPVRWLDVEPPRFTEPASVSQIDGFTVENQGGRWTVEPVTKSV